MLYCVVLCDNRTKHNITHHVGLPLAPTHTVPYIWLCLVVRHHVMLFDVPFEAQLYGSQAEAYLCLGDLQSAAGCYQQARRLQPSGGSCHHTRLALIYHLQVVHTHTHTHTHT